MPLESKMDVVSSVEVLIVNFKRLENYPKFWGGLSKTTLHGTSVLLAVETCTLANNAIIYGCLHDGHMI